MNRKEVTFGYDRQRADELRVSVPGGTIALRRGLTSAEGRSRMAVNVEAVGTRYAGDPPVWWVPGSADRRGVCGWLEVEPKTVKTRWVFTPGELEYPGRCAGDDLFIAYVPSDEGVQVTRDGKATNTWADGTRGVQAEVRMMVEAVEEYAVPSGSTYGGEVGIDRDSSASADTWRDVWATEDGEFVGFAEGEFADKPPRRPDEFRTPPETALLAAALKMVRTRRFRGGPNRNEIESADYDLRDAIARVTGTTAAAVDEDARRQPEAV